MQYHKATKTAKRRKVTPLAVKVIPIADIEVGKWFRKRFRNLEGLAASINKVGLLEPIGIDKDKRLVFGNRRLLAARDIIGWDSIPAVTVDLPSMIEGEYFENEERDDFTISERVAIAEALAEVEAPKADERMKAGMSPDPGDQSHQGNGRAPRTVGNPSPAAIPGAFGAGGWGVGLSEQRPLWPSAKRSLV